jgi:hypothetical protein
MEDNNVVAMAIEHEAENETTRALQLRDPASWRAFGYGTAADAAADWVTLGGDPRVRARAIEILTSVLKSADEQTR